MKYRTLTTRIEKQIAFLPHTELRLTATLALEELTTRRNNWVEKMYRRFSDKENAGMAAFFRMSDPANGWLTDRVIVNCFKDKSRSKISVGVARLAPNDEFDFRTGVAIAFARAMGEPVPDLF